MSDILIPPIIPIDRRKAKFEKQRFERESVNIEGLIDAFPKIVKPYILKGLHAFQMTDGCTGGCAWCALDVKRKITKGFSIESVVGFIEKHKEQLPDVLYFYSASDPMDIAGYRENGEKYDYSDLLKELLPILRPGQEIFTSTSLPLGTDEVAVKTLKVLHDDWKNNGKGKIKYEFRFSVADDDRGRVEKIKQRLLLDGIDSNFIEHQFALSENRTNKEIMMVGKFVRHPDRVVGSASSLSILSCDGLRATPDGIETEWMAGVTKSRPYGQFGEMLDPKAKSWKIPERATFYSKNDSQRMSEAILRGDDRFVFFPNAREIYIETGKDSWTYKMDIQSLLRDMNSMVLSTKVIMLLDEHVKEKGSLGDDQLGALGLFKVYVDDRYTQAKENMVNDPDVEAKLVIDGNYEYINERLDFLLNKNNK